MMQKIGVVFPGQGSQSVGMGKALYDAHPSLKAMYDEASSVLGYDVAELCFAGPAEWLNLTEFTQPALLVSSIAATPIETCSRLQDASESYERMRNEVNPFAR